MDIHQVGLKRVLECAYLAKEIYKKFPDELGADSNIKEHDKFTMFSKFPNAFVDPHHSFESDTQCVIMQEPGSDHVYLVFRGTEKWDDWMTNIKFTRNLFQVRNKEEDTADGETAVTSNEDDDFTLPDEDGVEEVSMSTDENESDDFILPPDEPADSEDDESDMHFEPVNEESGSKEFEPISGGGSKHFEPLSGTQAEGLAPTHPRAKLHRGFVSAYITVQDHVHKYIEKHQPKKITVTGHSLGGALATLCAVDMKLSYLGKYDVELFTFGAPRVGNAEFPELFNMAVLKSYRVVNGWDAIPSLPTKVQGFRHVNNEVRIGMRWSWRILSRRGTDHLMKNYIKVLEAL